jgi:hypothetical protein
MAVELSRPRRWGRTPYSKGIVLSDDGCGEALRPVAAWSTALGMAGDPVPLPKFVSMLCPLGLILADLPPFARVRAQARLGGLSKGRRAGSAPMWLGLASVAQVRCPVLSRPPGQPELGHPDGHHSEPPLPTAGAAVALAAGRFGRCLLFLRLRLPDGLSDLHEPAFPATIGQKPAAANTHEAFG